MTDVPSSGDVGQPAQTRAQTGGSEGPGKRVLISECRRRLRQDWELERHVVTEHAAWHAAGIASDGSRRMVGARHNIKPYPLTDLPDRTINVSDPDSRNLKTTRGWVQGGHPDAGPVVREILGKLKVPA